MVRVNVQAVADEVVKKRIAALAEIIASSTHKDSVMVAAFNLAGIGTKQSSNALMYLIEQTKDPVLREVMAASLITFSPHRNDYKERLHSKFSAAFVIDAFAAIEDIAPALRETLLWQEITTAIEQSLGGPGD
ncbi:MAG: hypothetical protein UT41_C0001G0251 [Candidatus Wolfebacteria bacterium GW2011_GWC2_39_22]|uniref:BEACH domain-containing protein n=1 Tax=Candidatus Wolfebacteria bacterium GW2011_GWC2_39_22 TaxID=1619013 RepID=A0A0G0RGE9_9BACT|nr:MAG: hypothetical protein UT41_C0001G0251 [Candidatus Wolfebacteria bacterium GW2011_GWC2_39_22]HBI25631.1 hypothetical protein [Candidatus Wolfebacteria bacterium]